MRQHPLFCNVVGIVLNMVVVALSSPVGALAGEDLKEGTVRKTEDGLHFVVPPDWPIEKRGGITAPIPVEEYLALKFKPLEAQMQSLEQRLSGLDIRLRVLEEQSKQRRLQSDEQASP